MSKLSKIINGFLYILIIALTSCSNSKIRNDTTIISVSIPPLADFARSVVGNRAEVQTLIPPGVNLHSFELGPESMKLVTNSDIYFRISEQMKFEEILLNKIGKENIKRIVNLSEFIPVKNNDPHIWLSPQNARMIIETMVKEFSEILPQHSLYFKNNSRRYLEKLDSIDSEISNIIREKDQKIIFVYHPAWSYFAEYYDLQQMSVEREGKSPKAKDLTEIIEIAKAKEISCIFFDPHFDNSSVLSLARTLDLKTDSLDPLPRDYLANLIEIGQKLKMHLK